MTAYACLRTAFTPCTSRTSVAGKSYPPSIRLEEELADHVLDLVRAAAAGPLSDGSAQVIRWPDESVGDLPAGVDLEPGSDQAARLTIAVDRPGEAYIDVGRHGTHLELWEKEGEGFDSALTGIIDAVVHGAYEEWVKLDRRGQLIAAKGVFRLPDGPRKVGHNTLGLFVERRPGWTHVVYEPYRSRDVLAS